MRILVVSSVHGYSTRDVWLKAVSGLRACGADVRPYDLLRRWDAFGVLCALAERRGIALPAAFRPEILAYEPVTGAALYHECDAVLIVSPQYMPAELPRILRRAGLLTAAYFTECPYEDTMNAPELAAQFDVAFVSDRHSVQLFRAFNERTFYLAHCYDPDVHYPGTGPRQERIVWVGTLYRSRVAFLRRARLDGLPLEIYGTLWARRNSRLYRWRKGDVMENRETAELYRRSVCSFNLHRVERYIGYTWRIDPGEAYSVNPRAFELAACGTFQVSDPRPELHDIFGDTVPVYDTPAGLGRLLRRAMEDPVWREDLARKQHQALLQGPHTCRERMAQALDVLAA